ncbi:DNA topoisomerase, partial [Pavlovales sp. CCMP2436]
MASSRVKVAQLSGYIGEHSAYHHGEDYVGANNINLLHPAGQFGTRLQDHASARYIFTRLSPITRAIFPEADDPDDGIPIEPTFYVPILPMVLVNGADGIGTGWATSVPNYNPSDIVVNLRRMMDGLEPEPMAPWYRGFNGAIEPSKAGSYQVTGKIEQIDATTVKVTELPLRKWTQDYKETLEGLMAAGKEGEAFVTDFKEHHTDTTVSFTISLSENSMAAALSEGLLKKFKLVGSLAESNLVLWDEHGRMKKILREFYAIRQRTYAKRKAWLTERLGNEWEKLRNKARFIQAVVDSELVIAKKTKAALVELLRAHKYLSIPNEKKAGIAGVDAEGSEAADDASTDADAGSSGGYDYLLSMPLWSLSAERLSALRAECDAKEAELNALLGKTPLDLWRTDLDNFETFVRAKEQADAESAAVAAKARKGGPSKPRAPSTK